MIIFMVKILPKTARYSITTQYEFFVNEKNPVNNLSTEQIRGIYAGDYTNWSEVGGVNRVINPVTRLSDSGSQSAMVAFMGNREIALNRPLRLPVHQLNFHSDL